jgi:hypothetical protein
MQKAEFMVAINRVLTSDDLNSDYGYGDWFTERHGHSASFIEPDECWMLTVNAQKDRMINPPRWTVRVYDLSDQRMYGPGIACGQSYDLSEAFDTVCTTMQSEDPDWRSRWCWPDPEE